MDYKLWTLYRQFRQSSPSVLVGRDAEMCLRAAKTVLAFRAAGDDVRIRCEHEPENYFDVYGREENENDQKALEATLERIGGVCVLSEFRNSCGEWDLADSIGMCVYENPESPFENCYVTDLMQSALDRRAVAVSEMCAAV